MLAHSDVPHILSRFPQVEFALAYGSGAVEQGGYDYSEKKSVPMLDLILAVDNSELWHRDNMVRNPSHYSPLIPLGASQIAMVQEKFGANFWFNTHVPLDYDKFPGRLLKYGVINKTHLLKDLMDWNKLYVAGRLHKPVHILKTCDIFNKAIETNRESALRASLLILPDVFNEIDLYLTIASLSYTGDPRMIVGENPKKVVNLVMPIVSHYQKLYRDKAEKLFNLTTISENNPMNKVYKQNFDHKTRWESCLQLPRALKRVLAIRTREEYLNNRVPNAKVIRSAVASIVTNSATMQTMKGLFTAGFIKSSAYLFAKISKRFKK